MHHYLIAAAAAQQDSGTLVKGLGVLLLIVGTVGFLRAIFGGRRQRGE